jgi:hypothetical protein
MGIIGTILLGQALGLYRVGEPAGFIASALGTPHFDYTIFHK